MGLRLFVVRHGATDWSRERRFAGSCDVPLNARGIRQCEAVALRLARRPLAAVYASPLERARMSAELIAKPHRLSVEVDPAFREMTFGAWEGLTYDEVAARFPDPYRTWRAAPQDLVAPGAERLADVAERVARGLEALQTAHAAATVALVTHAVVARLIVLDALGLGPDRLWAVDASPGGITEIEYAPGWATVHRMNTVAHLRAGGA